MANDRGKSIDKTFLSVDNAEERGFLHRDYLAHCLRWSHVIKVLSQGQQYKTATILDVGCGKEVPLAKTLYSMRMIVERYIGVDVNKLVMPDMFHTGKFPIELYGQCDFAEDVEVLQYPSNHDGPLTPMLDIYNHAEPMPNFIVSFEVLEHVEPEHVKRILDRMYEIAVPRNATLFISTPNWDPNVGAAANHVNEMKFEVLDCLFRMHGFKIINRWGTFASIRDYQHMLSKWQGLPLLFDVMRSYYDTNVLACLFAPLFPAQARNCLWELKPDTAYNPDEEPPHDIAKRELEQIKGPWSSSDKWQELL